MTLAPEAPIQTRDLQVRTDTAGKPLAIRHDGQIWLVDPDTESRHWFGREARRDTRRTAAVDRDHLDGIEYWRVQVRLGSNSALRTVTLRRDAPCSRWALENVSDGD